MFPGSFDLGSYASSTPALKGCPNPACTADPEDLTGTWFGDTFPFEPVYLELPCGTSEATMVVPIAGEVLDLGVEVAGEMISLSGTLPTTCLLTLELELRSACTLTGFMTISDCADGPGPAETSPLPVLFVRDS